MSLNRVFQIKMGLIALGLANVVAFEVWVNAARAKPRAADAACRTPPVGLRSPRWRSGWLRRRLRPIDCVFLSAGGQMPVKTISSAAMIASRSFDRLMIVSP